jgi:hypothetical protein
MVSLVPVSSSSAGYSTALACNLFMPAMKQCVLILFFLVSGMVARSQILISILLGDKLNTGKIEFGLSGGVNWSTIKGLDKAEDMASFNLGFFFDFKLKNPAWMINTGVMVKSVLGAKGLPVYSLSNVHLDSSFSGGSITRKIHYFMVPVLIKYQFQNKLFVKGGIQLGLRNKVFDEFKNSIKEEDDLELKLDIRDQYHRIDGGLAAGFGYHLMKGNGMNIEVQYYYGLVDLLKDPAAPDQFNRAIYLMAGIPIGKSPKKKKE